MNHSKSSLEYILLDINLNQSSHRLAKELAQRLCLISQTFVPIPKEQKKRYKVNGDVAFVETCPINTIWSFHIDSDHFTLMGCLHKWNLQHVVHVAPII